METTPQIHLTAKSLFERDSVKKKFEELLGKRAPGFITSVLQAVASNEQLKDAEPHSVFHAAAVAATLDLPINNNLGFAYIVPYKQWVEDPTTGNKKQITVAQFQMGYKGFIQLAQRTGQFQTIAETPIYEGQLIDENPLTGFRFDFTKKSDTIIGYAAYFRLINGFEKVLYAPVDKVEAHAKRFSKQYAAKGTGLWKDDFDSMARKTVLKALLSRYAPLSIEMQKAVITDQSVIKDSETLDVGYVDNEPVGEIEPEKQNSEAVEKTMADLSRAKANTEIRKQIRTLDKKKDGLAPDSTEYLSLQQEIEDLEKQIVKA